MSSVDKPFEVADVAKDVKVNPDGRLVLRDGYAQGFTVRPEWFDGTTLHSNRKIADVVPAGLGNSVNLSQRRNCILEGVNSATGTRYIFATAYIDKAIPAVYLWRGTVSANGETVSWSAPYIVQVGRLARSYTAADTASPGTQIWIEWSMAFNAAQTTLYIASIERDDPDPASGVGNNYSKLRAWKIENPYAADVANFTQTQLDLHSDGTKTVTIDSNDALTHDIDIAVDSLGRPTVAYGYYNAATSRYEIQIRAVHSGFYDTEPFVMTEAGYHLYGLKLYYNTVDGKMYLAYVRDEIAGAGQSIRLTSWANGETDPSPAASMVVITTAFQIETTATNSLWTSGCVMTADSAGAMHFLYRRDDAFENGNMQHSKYSGGVVTTILLPFTLKDYSTDAGVFTYILRGDLTNWDFVVKGGGVTCCVFIYYVEYHATLGYRIKRCESIDGGTFAIVPGYVHVSQQPGTKHCVYLCTDRVARSTPMRRLMFIDYGSTGPNVDLYFLSQEKDASLSQVSIEAMHEMSLPQVTGSPIQTTFVQCDDSRFYKRDSTMYHWEVLENTFDYDNAEEAWWRRLTPTIVNGGLALTQAPDPTPHAHFHDRNSVLRAGLGLGSKIVPIRYGLLNRKIYDGTGAYNYADHFLDVTPLQPPTSDILMPTVLFRTAICYIDERASNNWFGVAGTNPAFYNLRNENYRRFAHLPEGASMENGYVIDPDFHPNQNFAASTAHSIFIRVFRFGLTFIYDGFEESQIYHIPAINVVGHYERQLGGVRIPANTGLLWVGVGTTAGGTHIPRSFITVNLRLPRWDKRPDWTANPISWWNPRLTAIRVWMADVQSPEEKLEQSVFYPAKTIIVSKAAHETWKDEWHNGEKAWTINAAGTYFEHNSNVLGEHWPVVIDMNDYLNMFAKGDYESINGHSDVDFDTTYGLNRSPFMESYKYALELGDKTIYGGVRIDGVDRPNRMLISAKRSDEGSLYNTPSVTPDNLAKDFRFNIAGLSQVDDDTPVVCGDLGIVTMDARDLATRNTHTGVGVTAHDSIVKFPGGIGFLSDTLIRRYIGYGDPDYFGREIVLGSEVGGYSGISDLSDRTDCWAFYLGRHNQLLLFLRVSPYAAGNILAFRYDYIREGWFRMGLADAFKCGCTGIDGELFWTSGYKIFSYPYAGNDNGVALNPLYRFADDRIPEEAEVDIERLFVTHKTAGANLIATVIRDRGGLANIAHTITASATRVNTSRKLDASTGRRARREVSLQLSATGATTFEIEEIGISGVLMERVL